MYFLIISFGFLLAMRGARPAPLQKPGEGLRRIWREAADFFLTASLALTLWALALVFEKTGKGLQEYALLGLGIAAYLISRYQGKTDVFLLSVIASVFMIHLEQDTLPHEIFLAGVVSVGMALFQSSFLGLRYKLLFSRIPISMKGWPGLCLLAGFISLVLQSLWDLVF
jgi:hypothetical protein